MENIENIVEEVADNIEEISTSENVKSGMTAGKVVWVALVTNLVIEGTKFGVKKIAKFIRNRKAKKEAEEVFDMPIEEIDESK